MKEICFFDKDGNAINIGPWDHKVKEIDDILVETNPLPEGAYSEEKEIQINEDGSRSII